MHEMSTPPRTGGIFGAHRLTDLRTYTVLREGGERLDGYPSRQDRRKPPYLLTSGHRIFLGTACAAATTGANTAGRFREMSNEVYVHLLVLARQLSEVLVDHTQAAGAQPGTKVFYQAEDCPDLLSG